MAVPIVYNNFIAPAIDAGNLNTVNNVVYTVIGDGTNAPATAADVRTNIGLGVFATMSSPIPVANGGTGDSGTAWTSAAGGAVTSSAGTITAATSSIRYKIIGKTVFFSGLVTITNNGTGSGSLNVAAFLPVAPQGSIQISGREASVSGKAIIMQGGSGTSVNIFNYDNTYPAATGANLIINGVYESV